MKAKIVKIKSSIHQKPLASTPSINLVLINKLRILDQERKNLGQLLIAAIQENKQIKISYQLETMAKTRLTQHIEDSHRQIKENRSRYISFQQLYLIAHQENIFLKSRLKRLTKEKEDAERNLIELVNQVCLSKNNNLKNFCSRFIVNTHSNLLNCNVRHEINRFLKKCNVEEQNVFENTCRKDDLNDQPPNPLEISDFFDDERLISLVKDAPKLRGLPGEYVWTVKDKNGIIEKLYEYDTGFDNGDTIRRIRKYSVYCDKECLLDFSKYDQINMTQNLSEIDLSSISWKHIKNNSLDLEYAVAIPRAIANIVLKELEESLNYFTGDLAKIKVFGKVYPLPRQQVAYGDPGITYKYSGITVPALPWPSPVLELRNFLFKLKGIKYDFVLVNKCNFRYRNGNDHMGEHRDNEPELDPNFPIASISLGEERPFVLKHKDARKPGPKKKDIPKGNY
ncbi:unnamed protein product, partial [Brenthis ino]